MERGVCLDACWNGAWRVRLLEQRRQGGLEVSGLGLWGKERRGVPLKSIPVSFLGDVAKSACEVAQQERGVALVARRSVASLLKRGPSIEFLGNLLDMLACLFKCNMHGSKGPAWLPALYRPRELI
eukprot:1136809-Pelagomonas_calceolata.AAC.2